MWHCGVKFVEDKVGIEDVTSVNSNSCCEQLTNGFALNSKYL